MTQDHEAFLNRFLENPDDDTPRLVYADWLEERGEMERAEFIRVQCRLDEVARPERPEREILSDGTDVDALVRREQELIQSFMTAAGFTGRVIYCGAWPHVTPVVRIHASDDSCLVVRADRGVLCQIETTMLDWLKHGPVLVRNFLVSPEGFAISNRKPARRLDPWYVYCWWRSELEDPHAVPRDIHKRLRLHRHIHGTDGESSNEAWYSRADEAWYSRADEAWADLGRACVSWAKDL